MPEITPQILSAAFLMQTILFSFFCYSLYKTLLLVKETNRTIKPGLVWLLLVPGFIIFWNFKVVLSMTSSLYKEFTDRNFDIEDRPGFRIGMFYAVVSLLSPLFMILAVPQLVIAGEVLNIAGLLFFVQYWVKISWYRRVLETDDKETENTYLQ